MMRARSYRACLALSQFGIILAGMVRTKPGTKVVYLNDELWFNDFEKSLRYFPMKWLELRGCRKCDFIVTQDPFRGRILRLLNKLPQDKLFYLPNSFPGPAERSTSYYLHDLLNVDRQVKIVFWNGAATDGDGSLNIAQAAIDWGEDWLFVTHFRSSGATGYKKQLADLHGKGRNAHVGKNFSLAELDKAFASAHIGLALYPDRGVNAKHIGYSSGKLNAFLRQGVPCIVSAGSGLKWVPRSGAGLAVAEPVEVAQAMRRIDADYQAFSEGAMRVYEQLLRPDFALDSIVARL